MNPQQIKTNYLALKDEISDKAQLLAVTKKRTVQEIQYLYDLGQRHFGENKVQELRTKAQVLNNLNIHWHFIGHLQKNKVKDLIKIPGLKYIHSVDSLALASKLDTELKKQEHPKKIKVFIQVNTSNESEKYGLQEPSEIEAVFQFIQASKKIEISGFMTMSKIRTDDFQQDAQTCFSALDQLRAEWEKKFSIQLDLSMGMSQDYQIALEYGSQWLRLGSVLFK